MNGNEEGTQWAQPSCAACNIEFGKATFQQGRKGKINTFARDDHPQGKADNSRASANTVAAIRITGRKHAVTDQESDVERATRSLVAGLVERGAPSVLSW